MEYGLIEFFFLLIYTVIIIAVTRIIVKRRIGSRQEVAKTETANKAVNSLPKEIPTPTSDECLLIQCYQNEWKTIIETQMHFNDLIIRFRSIALTVLVTLLGASVALNAKEQIDEGLFIKFVIIVAVFWITAFVLDRYYYHRLLLGAVDQAMKFDDSQLGRDYGLFGLTTCIASAVHPPASIKLIYVFYVLPAIALITAVLLR